MDKILIVEDDIGIISGLCRLLDSEGFYACPTSGRTEALAALDKEKFDLVLLDISLSDGNGYSLCSTVKGRSDIPVIFLTASGDEGSIVAGFDIGADDYIQKPFKPRELISRIKNVLRRYNGNRNTLTVGNITIDADRGTVEKNGRELIMSALEYRILLYLFSNRGKILTRERLLEEIWDIAGDFVNDNTLTVYIKRIREKMGDDPTSPCVIKTVRGIGYRVD